MHSFICGQNCNLKFTHRPINGYRCVTDFVTYRYTDNIKDIQPYTCVHQCIRRSNCSIANYNIKQNACHLSNNVCALVEVDDSYQLSILLNDVLPRPTECFEWQPPPISQRVLKVTKSQCFIHSGPCSVSRLKRGGRVLPGTYFHSAEKLYAADDGETTTIGDEEILTVRAGCLMTLVRFIAGDTIPVGAVVGGHLGDDNSKVYVVRRRSEFGYYDPVSAQGYTPRYGDSGVTDELDIVVLL